MPNINLEQLVLESEQHLQRHITRAKKRVRLDGEAEVKRQSEVSALTNSVNILGHGNVVVTSSPGSKVQLKLKQSYAEGLSSAFDALRSAIAASGEETRFKNDLLEVIDDCRSESDKPAPNLTKFTGMLSGLATTIQTAASLAPAYAAFKSAAAIAGITLL